MISKLKRKRLIDKKFQLKIIFRVIGLTSIVFLVLIAVIGINTNVKIAHSSTAISGLNTTVDNLNKTIKTQDDIIKGFLKYSSVQESSINRGGGEGKIFLGIDKISKDHKESMDNIKKHMTFLDVFIVDVKGFFSDLRISLAVLFCVVLLQAIVLYFYLINMTHRISGPIYVISKHIQDLMQGHEPDLRALRKDDELQEFYASFVQLAELVKKAGNLKKKKTNA